MEQNIIQVNGGIMINVNMSIRKCHVKWKDYTWNPCTCSYENCKYLASVMDDSAITGDEVTESLDKETKTIPTKKSEKKE